MAVSNAREAAVTKSEVPMSDRLAAAFALDKVQSALPGGRPDGIPPHPAHRVRGRFPRAARPPAWAWSSSRTGSPRNPITAPMPLKAKRPATATTTPPLAEWMRRRLESGPPWADLVLIDGGRGQVSAVQRIVRESNAEGLFLLAGIAKARDDMGRADRRGRERGRPDFPARPEQSTAAARRFRRVIVSPAYPRYGAPFRHRAAPPARAGAALSAELLRIPGVGKATARLLWDHFKALDAIIAATPAQLAAIPRHRPPQGRSAGGQFEEVEGMNWGRRGLSPERPLLPPPNPTPFSPKDFCKGLWRNGRHGRPNLGARLPGRLQNPFYSHKDLS